MSWVRRLRARLARFIRPVHAPEVRRHLIGQVPAPLVTSVRLPRPQHPTVNADRRPTLRIVANRHSVPEIARPIVRKREVANGQLVGTVIRRRPPEPSAAVADEPEQNSGYREQEAGLTTADRPSQKNEKTGKNRRPRRYQGLDRSAPEPRESRRGAPCSGSGEPAPRDRSLPLEVRLRFDRGGFCTISLIAKRCRGLPEEITVATQSGELELSAMQDEWYQDIVPDDVSGILRDGTVWMQRGAVERCTWSLSGRELYVLAARSDISGFVSQACLELGREHAVLCGADIRSRVEQAIRATDAAPTSVFDESLGAPPGWIVFRGVVPKKPVTPVGEADIFNALRPLPRIEISLEGGIRVEYANWLEGYPPCIRVYGDPEHAAEVRIDGQVAVYGNDGYYRAPGWDSIGSHTVWCSGISKTYSVVPFAGVWDWWDAFAFPVSGGSKGRIGICGPMVRWVSDGPESCSSLCVPESNSVVLGRTPGQIVVAEAVSGVRGALSIASPPFCAVWALPRDPLHSDKQLARILLVGEACPPETRHENPRATAAHHDASLEAWCRLILDASRKRMSTQPDTESVRALWLEYKRLARRIWRSRK